MGWQLREHVERHAPDALSKGELLLLGVLASNARADRLVIPYHPTTIDDTMRRGRIKSRASLRNTLSALVSKGGLLSSDRGRNGVRAVYEIPLFGVPLDLGDGTLPGVTAVTKGPENQDASQIAGGAKGPGFRDASSAEGSRKSVRRVPDSGTPFQYQEKPPAPTRDPQRSLLIHAVPEGGGDSHDQGPTAADAARELLSSLPAPFNRLGPGAVDKLAPEVTARLAGGWPIDELAAELGGRPVGVTRPAGTLRWRLENEIPVAYPGHTTRDVPVTTVPRPVRDVLSPGCPKCHSNNGQPGWVPKDPTNPDGEVVRCTACPTQIGATA